MSLGTSFKTEGKSELVSVVSIFHYNAVNQEGTSIMIKDLPSKTVLGILEYFFSSSIYVTRISSADV